jgi:hypothetical protein
MKKMSTLEIVKYADNHTISDILSEVESPFLSNDIYINSDEGIKNMKLTLAFDYIAMFNDRDYGIVPAIVDNVTPELDDNGNETGSTIVTLQCIGDIVAKDTIISKEYIEQTHVFVTGVRSNYKLVCLKSDNYDKISASLNLLVINDFDIHSLNKFASLIIKAICISRKFEERLGEIL